MRRNLQLFLNVGEHSLYMDLILVEYRQPILFTCIDEKSHMYLVTCFRADSQERDWLIAETEPERIISLLSNELTIRDAFPTGDCAVYWVKKARNTERPSVRECRADEIPGEFFPTPGMFMDTDEGEFKEELAELRTRAAKQEEFHAFTYSTMKMCSDFMWSVCCFPVFEKLALLESDSFRTIPQKRRRVYSYEYECV